MCAFPSAAYDGTIADAAKCHLRFAVESSSMDATMASRRRNAKDEKNVFRTTRHKASRNETTYASANDEERREKRREHRGRPPRTRRRDAHRQDPAIAAHAPIAPHVTLHANVAAQ